MVRLICQRLAELFRKSLGADLANGTEPLSHGERGRRRQLVSQHLLQASPGTSLAGRASSALDPNQSGRPPLARCSTPGYLLGRFNHANLHVSSGLYA